MLTARSPAGSGPRRLNAGSLPGDGSDPHRQTAGCAASTLWTSGRMLNRRAEHPKQQLMASRPTGDQWSPSTQAVSSLSIPLLEVGASQDPSPLIFRRKRGGRAHPDKGLQLHEEQAGPFKKLPAFVWTDGQGSL